MKTRGTAKAEPALLVLRTSWGELRIQAHAGRIVACELPFVASRSDAPELLDARRVAVEARDRAALAGAERYVRALFAGRAATCPPVTLPPATPFMHEVWTVLRKIPRGQTMTYGEVARAVGCPRAARAAGSACGANPIPLFIPCHRVLGSNGAFGGFSAGLAWKRWLLQCEGAGA